MRQLSPPHLSACSSALPITRPFVSTNCRLGAWHRNCETTPGSSPPDNRQPTQRQRPNLRCTSIRYRKCNRPPASKFWPPGTRRIRANSLNHRPTSEVQIISPGPTSPDGSFRRNVATFFSGERLRDQVQLAICDTGFLSSPRRRGAVHLKKMPIISPQ